MAFKNEDTQETSEDHVRGTHPDEPSRIEVWIGEMDNLLKVE